MMGTVTERKLLDALLVAPELSQSESHLISLAGSGKGSASDCIGELEKEHIVRVERKGRTKMISLRRETPAVFFFKLLRDEEKKKRVEKERLSAILLFIALVRETTSMLIAFGSTIARTTKENSDIDLLLVSDDFEAVESARRKTEELFGFHLNIHEETKGGVRKKMGIDSFITGIVLKGVIFQGYDLARELYAQLPEKTIDFSLWVRTHSALKNYDRGDAETSDAIVQEILDKTLFLIAEKTGVFVQGREDARKSIRKTPLGKLWERTKSSRGKERLIALHNLTKEIIEEEVLRREGYV